MFLFSVPSAPADIKAVVSSRNKILVSWLPPAAPNGVLVGYTLYMSVIEDGREVLAGLVLLVFCAWGSL